MAKAVAILVIGITVYLFLNKTEEPIQVGLLSNYEYHNYVVEQVKRANDCDYWEAHGVPREDC